MNGKATLLDKFVIITDKENMYYKEWGIIKHVDEYYHVAIANGDSHTLPIFDRGQFKIPKKDLRKAAGVKS